MFKKSKNTGFYLPESKVISAGVFRHAVRRAGDNRHEEELDWIEDHNLVVNVGMQYILNTSFHSGSASTAFY